VLTRSFYFIIYTPQKKMWSPYYASRGFRISSLEDSTFRFFQIRLKVLVQRRGLSVGYDRIIMRHYVAHRNPSLERVERLVRTAPSRSFAGARPFHVFILRLLAPMPPFLAPLSGLFSLMCGSRRRSPNTLRSPTLLFLGKHNFPSIVSTFSPFPLLPYGVRCDTDQVLPRVV